ncbi:hypothetical protein B0H11DRAFT_1975857 [Mycena galericulata]|nr:hypothetical protein B0H11DRAFT_1975857 [Mycena galericulata]
MAGVDNTEHATRALYTRGLFVRIVRNDAAFLAHRASDRFGVGNAAAALAYGAARELLRRRAPGEFVAKAAAVGGIPSEAIVAGDPAEAAEAAGRGLAEHRAVGWGRVADVSIEVEGRARVLTAAGAVIKRVLYLTSGALCDHASAFLAGRAPLTSGTRRDWRRTGRDWRRTGRDGRRTGLDGRRTGLDGRRAWIRIGRESYVASRPAPSTEMPPDSTENKPRAKESMRGVHQSENDYEPQEELHVDTSGRVDVGKKDFESWIRRDTIFTESKVSPSPRQQVSSQMDSRVLEVPRDIWTTDAF